jgi:hypothetical protein
MLKNLLIAFVACSLSATVMAQVTPQKISEKVSVSFPGKPEETKNPMGGSIYAYKKDSSNAYMAMALDLTNMGLTAEMVESMGDGLWDQMMGGMTQQMPGAVIGKTDKIQIKGKEGRYLEIDGTNSTAPNLKGKKAYCYLFFMGATLHQFAFYTDKKDASDAKPFFDSITIDK